MYYKYIVATTLGLFFGIIISFKFNFSTEVFFVSLILVIVNFLVYKFSKRSFGVYKSSVPIVVSFLFFGLALGILLGQFNLSSTFDRQNDFKNFISQKDSFTGVVSDTVISQNSQQFILNLNEDKNFKIKVTTGIFPKYVSGQELSITGKVVTEKIILPNLEQNNKSFDISQKDRLSHIDGQISFPKITNVSEKSTQNFFLRLENTKNNFIKTLERNVSLDAAALSAGTTLGDSSLFTKEDTNAFRVSGLSHIIVLSGFNITILIFILIYIFSQFNLKLFWRVTLSIFSIICFITFVGAGPSLVRAGIMGSALLVASLFGRQYLARQALFLSAFLMIILNPKIALYDVSFHLSFLATLGILYIVPILENYKLFQKDKTENILLKNILEVLKVTLAVQIIVTPYIMFVFGKVSLLGLFANILVVPFVPFIMLLAVLIIFFSFFANFISIFLGYISFIFCEYIFIIARFISSLPFAQVVNYISSFSMSVIYLILFFLIYFESKRQKINSYFKNKS